METTIDEAAYISGTQI